jgi:hypothetical protein
MNITAKDLRRAADIQEEIESLNSELEKILGGGGNGVPSPKGGDVARFKAARAGGKPKRKMSAKARAAIGAAQKARWAKVRAEKEKK